MEKNNIKNCGNIIKFNTDPVNIFWSIILILVTLIDLIILIYSYKNINDLSFSEDNPVFTINYIIFIMIQCCTTVLTIMDDDNKIEIYIEQEDGTTFVSLWMFSSIVILILVIIIELAKFIFNYTILTVNTINDNIRSIFSKSDENPKYMKPLWKRIVSKIAGIK